MKPNKYLLILLVTVAGYVLVEYYRPKPLDWTPTYQNNDKIPFGTQALYELLPDIMQQQTIRPVRLPVYNFLTDSKLPVPSNYVFISEQFKADANDLNQLLAYVGRGNNVLIAAYNLPDTLGASLGFKAEQKNTAYADSTLRQNFVNPQLSKSGGYNFSHDDGRNYLILKNSRAITVLGRNARREPVFIKIQYGRGQFLVHNMPLAFTNYYVLNPKTSDYAVKALSYLPAGLTYWDEYMKQGRFDKEQQSIFRYVRSQPALNWAYYVILFGLILFAIFAGKRTQRVIPVIETPRNTSVEFVKTVSRLYFQQSDHGNLARKKVHYFLANLRDRYGLSTNSLDSEFTELLAQKSGIDRSEAIELVELLRQVQQRVWVSEHDLLTLNAAIEKFNQTA